MTALRGRMLTALFGVARRRWLPPLVLALLILMTRSVWLDRDLPPFALSELQPIDELYYTISAFNLVQHGSVTHQLLRSVPTDGDPTNVLENAMTAVTLLLFGNNYYGLRMASVLAGVLISVGMYAIIRRAFASLAIALAVSAYLLIDFPLLLAERVAEPTIFRLLALVIVLLAAGRVGSRTPSPWASLALGALAGAAVLYVYPYNAFIMPAVLVALLIAGWRGGWRAAFMASLMGAVGMVAVAASYLLVLAVLFGHNPAQAYADFYGSKGHGLTISGDWRQLYYLLTLAASTNIFRLNFGLLIAFAAALPFYAARAWRQRRLLDVAVMMLLLMLVVQSLAIGDYPHRKLLVVLPLVTLVIAGGFTEFRALAWRPRAALREGFVTGAFAVLVGQGVFTIFSVMAPRLDQLALLAPLLGLFAIILGTEARVLVRSGGLGGLAAGVYSVFAAQLIWNVWFVSDAVAGGTMRFIELVAAWVVVALLLSVWIRRLPVAWLGVALAMALAAPSVGLDARSVYSNKSYAYRDAMRDAAHHLDGRVVAGGWSYGFRLYNTSQPILSWYNYAYRQGGIPIYREHLDRVFADGQASAAVDNVRAPDSDPWLQLGLVVKQTYVIGSDQPPIAVYGRP